MGDDDILLLLQTDLGEFRPLPARQEFLRHTIRSARAFIAREGVALTESVEDAELIEMYAAYLVRKRSTTEAMPRMLRWALNNRLFSSRSEVKQSGP